MIRSVTHEKARYVPDVMSSATTAAQRELDAQPFTVVESSFDTPPGDAQSEKLKFVARWLLRRRHGESATIRTRISAYVLLLRMTK